MATTKFCEKCGYNMGMHRATYSGPVCPALPPIASHTHSWNELITDAGGKQYLGCGFCGADKCAHKSVPGVDPVPAANDRQVGGKHYADTIQHWDYAASNHFDYFQGQITKYVHRWRRKNGVQDLEKAKHFLEKYIEEVKKGTFT